MSFPFHFLFILTHFTIPNVYAMAVQLHYSPYHWLRRVRWIYAADILQQLLFKKEMKKWKTPTNTHKRAPSELHTRHPPGPKNRLCSLISSPTCNMSCNNHPALHCMQSPLDTDPSICTSSTSFQTIRQSRHWMEVEEENRLFGLNERN